MLQNLIAHAGANGIKLAPLIGIDCSGAIREDGSIERGAQNLPGNWEDDRYQSSLFWRADIGG